MKIKKLTIVLMLLPILTFGQYDREFTQYLQNRTSINPAYAGVRESLSLFGMHREQWVGVNNAPTFNTVSAVKKFEDSNVGLGGEVVNETVGNYSSNYVNVNFAYVIPTSEKYKLSFGLKATANFTNLDYSKLTPETGSDGELANGSANSFNPNFGTGLYFYSDKTEIGFSIPYLLKMTDFKQSAIAGALKSDKPIYFLTGSHRFDLSRNVQFKPLLLLRYSNIDQDSFQVDLTANFLLYERVTASASYRVGDAFRAMVGFYVSKSLLIGYGYDISTKELGGYNQGSHDFMLRYEMFNRGNRASSPRFF